MNEHIKSITVEAYRALDFAKTPREWDRKHFRGASTDGSWVDKTFDYPVGDDQPFHVHVRYETPEGKTEYCELHRLTNGHWATYRAGDPNAWITDHENFPELWWMRVNEWLDVETSSVYRMPELDGEVQP
jgi:hypothetical protein